MRKWKEGTEIDISFKRPENQMNEAFTNKEHMELQELPLDANQIIKIATVQTVNWNSFFLFNI